MRHDMQKVIVERPRLTGDWSPLKNPEYREGPLNPESEPRDKFSMRRTWLDRKELNENLAPLVRFLRSRLGRPWDDVYSEICQNLSKNSAVQLHVFQHLFDYVERNCQFIEHRLCDSRGIPIPRWSRGVFYVHPKTGHLQEWTAKQKKKHERRLGKKNKGPRGRGAQDRVWKNHDPDTLVQYLKYCNIWYEVKLLPMEGAGLVEDKFFHIWAHCSGKRRYFNPNLTRLYTLYGGYYYATKKRQLNSKEIKRLGLK